MTVEWISMQERTPPPDTVCAVMLRYTLDRPPIASIDTWAMQREDPTGMGGPTIETGYGWDDNWEADVLAWISLPEFSADDVKRCARCDEEKDGEPPEYDEDCEIGDDSWVVNTLP